MKAYRNGLSPKNGFLKKGNKAMFLYQEYPSQISMSFVYSTYLLKWDGFIAANFVATSTAGVLWPIPRFARAPPYLFLVRIL